MVWPTTAGVACGKLWLQPTYTVSVSPVLESTAMPLMGRLFSAWPAPVLPRASRTMTGSQFSPRSVDLATSTLKLA